MKARRRRKKNGVSVINSFLCIRKQSWLKIYQTIAKLIADWTTPEIMFSSAFLFPLSPNSRHPKPSPTQETEIENPTGVRMLLLIPYSVTILGYAGSCF